MWCIHTVELTQPLHGRNCVWFYRIGSDFHIIDNLSIADHAFIRCILMTFSVDETLLPRYVNLSSNFWELPFRVEMSSFLLKHIHSVLSVFKWRTMPPAACSRLCNGDSALVGVFKKKRYVICVVCFCYSLCGISSASWFFSGKLFSFIRSIDVRST